MEEWLHCNRCLLLFVDRKKPCTFYLTNCGHIFCEACEKVATNPVCFVCNQKCSCTQLNDKLDASVTVFFKPSAELQKKAIEDLKKAIEVGRFQAIQRKMLMKSVNKKVDQQNKLLDGAMHNIEHLKKEAIELKKIILKNRANISLSPSNASLYPPPSPDRSPRMSPSHSPRISPSNCRKTPPQFIQKKSPHSTQQTPPNMISKPPQHYYSNAPVTPIKVSSDSHLYAANLNFVSPNSPQRRVSLRSPPVNGKIYLSSNRYQVSSSPQLQGYQTAEGIVSHPATAATMKRPHPQGSSTTNLNKPQLNCPVSPNSFGMTSPSIPKHSQPTSRVDHSLVTSCPSTPENKFHAFYSMLEKRRH